jgi:hypothetical protein
MQSHLALSTGFRQEFEFNFVVIRIGLSQPGLPFKKLSKPTEFPRDQSIYCSEHTKALRKRPVVHR